MWPEEWNFRLLISPRTRTNGNVSSTVRFSAAAISLTLYSGRLARVAAASLMIPAMIQDTAGLVGRNFESSSGWFWRTRACTGLGAGCEPAGRQALLRTGKCRDRPGGGARADWRAGAGPFGRVREHREHRFRGHRAGSPAR